MRTSLTRLLRKLAFLAIASTSFASARHVYAHDIPIFDPLIPHNSFGIGTCGFQLDGRMAVSLIRQGDNGLATAQVPQTESVAPQKIEPKSAWSLSSQFSESLQDMLLQYSQSDNSTSCHDADSSVANKVDCVDKDPVITVGGDTTFFSDKHGIAAQPSNVSILVASLALLRAVGTQIPKAEFKDSIASLPTMVRSLIESYKPVPVLASQPTAHPTYLGSRKLVDDYLADESFVRKWRDDQSYRGLNRFDYLQQQSMDSLAIAEPNHVNADIESWFGLALSYIDDFQCRCSQELYDGQLTKQFSRRAGVSLAQFESQSLVAINQSVTRLAQWTAKQSFDSVPVEYAETDSFFGQPAFVIYRLEGTDFLLPARQAKHWNCVPSFPTITGGSTTQLASDNQSSQSVLIRELAGSVSDGLDLIARQLQQLAGQLRQVAAGEAQIANRYDTEGIR